MHRPIKKFTHYGEIADDAAIPRLRIQLERTCVEDMRVEGIVPVLDLGPYLALDYDQQRDIYRFTLTIYGVYVGKRKAEQIEGWGSDRMIPRAIPKTKSARSAMKSE